MAEVLPPPVATPPRYTARVLPPEEFDRLAAVPLYASVRDSQALVVVVETADGTVIATWAVLNVFHLEGAWVDPAYRHTSVAGRLVGEMFDALRTLGLPEVFTITQTDEAAALAHHLGGQAVPGQAWIIPVPPESA